MKEKTNASISRPLKGGFGAMLGKSLCTSTRAITTMGKKKYIQKTISSTH